MMSESAVKTNLHEPTTQEVIADLQRRVSALESKFSSAPPKPKETSIAEFIIEKKPVGEKEKTFYIGYYLETVRGVSPFYANDLATAYREAKEPVPTNINVSISRNVQRGYFMESAEKKENLLACTLTNTGLRAAKSPEP